MVISLSLVHAHSTQEVTVRSSCIAPSAVSQSIRLVIRNAPKVSYCAAVVAKWALGAPYYYTLTLHTKELESSQDSTAAPAIASDMAART